MAPAVQSLEIPVNEISSQPKTSRQGVIKSVFLEQTPGSRVSDHDAISQVAYELWQARGCPEGSSETDWQQAEERLQLVRLSDHVSNR